MLAVLFEQLNIWVHHNSCDTRNNELKLKTLKHLLDLDQSQFDTHSKSDIDSKTRFDCINNQITWNIPYIIQLTLRILISYFFILNINSRLGIILMLSLFVFYQVKKHISAKRIYMNTIHDKLSRNMNYINDESLTMIQTIKLFSKEYNHLNDMEDATSRYLDNVKFTVLLRNIEEFWSNFQQTFVFCIICFIILHSGYFLTNAQVISIFLLQTQTKDLVNRIDWHVNLFQEQFPHIHKYYKLMKEERKLKNGDLKPQELIGSIKFEDVTFSQPSRPAETILKNVSFSIKQKAKTAIVGDSGAGKSTITNLLMRLYDPKKGKIYVDNTNLKDYDISCLHEKMAIVNQTPTLFDNTLFENIAQGVDNANYDSVVKASKLAKCYDFIQDFKSKFSTYAGGQGSRLSGGQRQRLIIARAALKNPDILILDEATSALDSENEALVKEALESLMKDKTTVIIAHRLNTIINADDIICMKHGEVVEQGNHEELMKLNGEYSNLIRKQLIGKEENDTTNNTISKLTNAVKFYEKDYDNRRRFSIKKPDINKNRASYKKCKSDLPNDIKKLIPLKLLDTKSLF